MLLWKCIKWQWPKFKPSIFQTYLKFEITFCVEQSLWGRTCFISYIQIIDKYTEKTISFFFFFFQIIKNKMIKIHWGHIIFFNQNFVKLRIKDIAEKKWIKSQWHFILLC